VHEKHLLERTDEDENLHPTNTRHLRTSRKAIGHVFKFKACGWRQIAREFEELGSDVAHARPHRHAAMLQFGCPSPFESLHVPVFCQAQRVEETNGRLHAEFVFKGSQRRVCVESPIAPRHACKAILEEHADDGNHGQTPVRELRA